tara:strand:+ start:423 stop:740 length:318 start_codon:yes stop_codon:yes gene_type:complete
MVKKLTFLIFTVFFNFSFANNSWVGNWIASDEWQSEFNIIIKADGSAKSDYGAGEIGEWKNLDGNLEIIWESGKKDYIFNGVMGFQRIRKTRQKSYTSGIRKSLD